MSTFIANLKVKRKLSFLFTTMLVLLAVTSVVAFASLTLLQSNVTGFYEEDYQSRIYANRMMRYFEQTQKDMFLAILEGNQEEINSYVDSAADAGAMLYAEFEELQKIYTGSVDLNTLSSQLSTITPIRQEIADLAIQQRNDEAYVLTEEEWVPALQAALGTLQLLIDDTTTQGDKVMTDIRTQVFLCMAIIAIILVVSVIVGLYINKKINHSILEPVQEIKLAAEELAEGNFELELSYESADEFGEVVQALRNTVTNQKAYLEDLLYGITSIARKNLNVSSRTEIKGDFIPLRDGLVETLINLDQTINELQNTALQVSQGSEQLAQTSQALAEGATEQAGAVEELLATITDVTTQVEDNARSASDASNRAEVVDHSAQESSTKMSDMMQAMNRISETSKQIENIAKLIEDIASQTNMLSLNASIEAARAGEAGRGFAVVAGEISDLASQSAKAAANTRQLIEESIREVESGNKIAEGTSKALEDVRQGIGEIATVVRSVMVASEHQAEAMGQISIGIEQISSVVQNNAASAQEGSATSEELSAQAQSLNALAAEFTLINK